MSPEEPTKATLGAPSRLLLMLRQPRATATQQVKVIETPPQFTINAHTFRAGVGGRSGLRPD